MVELEEYIKAVEKQIKALQDLKPEDREDLSAGLEQCIEHINASTLGWAKWLSRHQTMKNFTTEELTENFERMRKIALDFLQIDVDATKTFMKKIAKDKEQKPKKDDRSKQAYVA